MMEFFMSMVPPTTTQQEHKVRVVNGKPIFYDPPELKAARAKLTDHIAGYAPDDPIKTPVELVVKWCFPATEDHLPGEYRATKPDTDNLQKLLKDCMTRCRYWNDDALVVREIVEKFWSDRPGIYVRIAEIDNG